MFNSITMFDMEFTKPIYEIHQKMKEAGSEIYRKAMTRRAMRQSVCET